MKLQPFLFALFLVAFWSCADPPTGPDASQDPDANALPSPEAQAPSIRITINPFSAVIQVGSSIQFVTVIRDSGRQVWPDVSWSISDSTIATVSENGLVTGLRPGETALTASCPGGVHSARIIVQDSASPVLDELSWSFALVGAGLAPIYDVWGSSGTDVFAVGASILWDMTGYGQGTILHFDGVGWSYMPVAAGAAELFGVWGSSPEDVFAVGAGGPGDFTVILHYDGMRWTRMPTPAGLPLYGVWGSSATDVVAVGYGGDILHYDGSRWTSVREGMDGGDVWWDIWGTPDGEYFAVGSGVLHFSEGGWSRMKTPEGHFFGVWGSSGSDVFAVGSGGVIIHYDGTAWSRMESPPRDGDLIGVWGNSPQDVFAVGDMDGWGPGGCCSDVLHFDGTSWRVLTGMSGQSLEKVWTTPERAFIVGTGPTIIHGVR
jgi:hypothetical protein